ncbi:hypothetical protein SSX86_010184 [Deinandra increscens subsp. villosa]|uniref:BHLH domain-containing protein n=1 Tax=Deinandra increscens subsp. villosa TaxID=3103831 RepID=A0AAP0DET4_9ASTR
MAAPSFYSNWTTFHNRHLNSAAPPPPELVPFHDNFTFSDSTINSNHHSTSLNINNGLFTNNNHLQFHNSPISYPSISAVYNPITAQQQLMPAVSLPELTQSSFGFGFGNEYFSDQMVVHDACDIGEFFPVNPVEPMQLCNQPEYYSYPPYPVPADTYSLEHVQQELPPFPETYDGGGPTTVILPSYDGGAAFNVNQCEKKSVQMKEINGEGSVRLSAQSMAARVRRRKISEKTSELGKLVPGGQRMTTAEMFQAAFKYIKFLQAQVGVLQLMSSSPGLGSELQGLLTCPSVQEKLYTAGKCIVSQTVGESLADDHH